jgi:hypothetical protein
MVLETTTPVIELRKAVFDFVGAATVTGSVRSNISLHEVTGQWNIRRSSA